MEGWIKVHRKILQWQWITSPNHVALMAAILLRANFKETKWRKITISPGQLLTGRKQLSIWTGLSEQQVRTTLRDLINSKEITSKSFSKFSVITITNWSKYQQDQGASTSRAPQQSTSNQPAINQQITTSKNAKKVKKEKNINNHDPFLDWLKTFQEITGRKNGDTKDARRFVAKLDQQGFTLEDCSLVCKSKFMEWGQDEKMSKYVNTSTLFGNKFERYLDDAKLLIEQGQDEEEKKFKAFFGMA